MTKPNNKIIIYKAPGGSVSLEVKLEGETVWLDTHQMAQLFDRDRTVIVRHIRNIYQTKELYRSSTCAKNTQVAADGISHAPIQDGKRNVSQIVISSDLKFFGNVFASAQGR